MKSWSGGAGVDDLIFTKLRAVYEHHAHIHFKGDADAPLEIRASRSERIGRRDRVGWIDRGEGQGGNVNAQQHPV